MQYIYIYRPFAMLLLSRLNCGKKCREGIFWGCDDKGGRGDEAGEARNLAKDCRGTVLTTPNTR